MENNENFVAEQVAENVEQTTEQTPVKTYTQEEVDAMMGKRVARTEAKIRKEYDRKYGRLEEVLKAGTGKESVEEMTDTFKTFYEKKGIAMPQQTNYSARDVEVLAKAEADEIISGGFDEVVEEVNRLAELGVDKMTARERALFKTLAEYRQSAERGRELGKIGVTEDVYNSQEFKKFASQFNPTTPIKDIYDIYRQTQPKKEIKTMGSMKQNPETGVKDFYTPEEIARLTEEDLDNPKVWEAVRRSMTGS